MTNGTGDRETILSTLSLLTALERYGSSLVFIHRREYTDRLGETTVTRAIDQSATDIDLI